MDVGDDIRPCQHEHVVVALKIVPVLREASAAEIGFAELPALDHRAHRAVKDDDALGKNCV